MKTIGALDGSSIFTREYVAKTSEGELALTHLDDLLEYIQNEMLTAFEEKEIVIVLRRIEGNNDGNGKNI